VFVHTYQTGRCYIPEDGNTHPNRCENLTVYPVSKVLFTDPVLVFCCRYVNKKREKDAEKERKKQREGVKEWVSE